VVTLDWARALLLGTEPAAGGAMAIPYLPETENRLARFDLWAGRVTRLAASGRTLSVASE
jgi:hypothetical protein